MPVLVFLVALSSVAQSQSRATSGITMPIDDRVRTILKGNVHPLAQTRYDQGAVADSFPAERLLLLLQRSPEREAALRQFLQDAHRLGNSGYHKWLTPEQFGELYGPEDSDVAAVSGWLQGHGFSIARVTAGKTAIEFSGTAGQIRDAFHTEIHTYLVNGEPHHANNLNPQVPAALASVVAGITPLNDFRPQSYVREVGKAVYDRSTHKLVPQWTFPAGPDVLLFGPGDFALQYDLNPLYAAGVTGTGVTIGIIGDSNVDPSVAAIYRSFFGLPANPLNVVVDGIDPGINGDGVESYLDVEQSGAVAPGATINLYTSADTSLQYGLNLAAVRAVDDDVATVLSTSYGGCEQDMGSAGNQFWASLWEQAAAQGQTAFVSSGDGGPAGCDNFNAGQAAQDGIAVNAIASTPWNVAVGGTDFYYSSYNGTASAQQTQLETYWDTVPTLFPTTSLLQSVPEQPWNQPFGLNLYSGGVYNPNAPNIVGGSGGPSSCSVGVEGSNGAYSSCTGGYAKPAWQSGDGVPADGVRDLPDVSLFAAAGENGSFYPICTGPGECVVTDGDLTVGVVGGTSASSPAMAGIMALVNQKYGAQGQANFTLYPLAAQHPSAFHDIAVGSNVVPCQQGSANCTLSANTDNTKGFFTLGYYAGKGYDLATGLGSVDANALVQNWNSISFKSTSTTLSLSQTSFTHGTPVNVNVGVSGSGGTPSGDVALVTTASPTSNTGVSDLTLQGGAASATVNSLPGGQYKITARYGGDSLFASSASTPVTVDVAPEASSLSLFGTAYSYNTNTSAALVNGGTYPYGTYIALDASVAGGSAASGSIDGIATGTVVFTDAASTGAINSGPVNVGRASTAIWIPTQFGAGSHSVTASYSGDSSFNASSTAAPLTFTVTKVTPVIDLYQGLGTNPVPVGVGQPVTLTVTAGIYSGAAPPTGIVTFYFGNKVLGTAPLLPSYDFNAYSPVATLTVTSLPLGTDTVTARYSGDANFNAVTSNAVAIPVIQAATVTAVATPSTLFPVQNFTVTANVAGANGQPAPTGGVVFYAYGPGGSWTASGSLVNGSASYTFTGPYWSPGTVYVDVGYSGDTNYAAVDVTIPVTMANPFTMAATPVVIAAPGATTGNTSTITVTPATGFTGTVYFSCTLTYYPPGAQHLPTCSVPASFNVTNANPVAATMTISSAPPTTTALSSHSELRWLAAQGSMFVAAFVLIGIPGCRRSRRRLGLLVAAGLIACLAGCGGGSSMGGGGGGGRTIPGTTPGAYSFMLEGSFTTPVGSSVPQVVIVNVTIQ